MHQDNISSLANILNDIPTQLAEESFQTIFSQPGVRVERIVSFGHRSPEGFWYDQEQHELVLLLSGAARLQFEGDEAAVELGPGAIVNIPPHRRHRVDWTVPNQPTIWLAIHCDNANCLNTAAQPSPWPKEFDAKTSGSN